MPSSGPSGTSAKDFLLVQQCKELTGRYRACALILSAETEVRDEPCFGQEPQYTASRGELLDLQRPEARGRRSERKWLGERGEAEISSRAAERTKNMLCAEIGSTMDRSQGVLRYR
ncbi:hypothetical protein NDU88_005576 [Pleurodeles waltl]|uniref:Uncharacterized protein n=1 Tax=Pleurodeles waltl TaxID=8319 RepID=A0AAV7MYH5_PLEWA|nr:hypothetical protein NDU88_005576 [Pleurodeles waltl]